MAEETGKDQKLQVLKQAIEKGHVDTVQNPTLKEFTRFFEELAIVEGIICRSDRILLPEALQQEVIEIAHEAHQGITKTKQYVRSRMWFPRMDSLIENRLKGCVSCQAATDNHQKEPLNPTEMPKQPWNTLCTDLYGPLPSGEYLIMVQCLNSRFPELAITHSTSAAAVIPTLDRILASYGTPEVIFFR